MSDLYDELDDVPDDEPPEPDGDDSVPPAVRPKHGDPPPEETQFDSDTMRH